MIIVSARERSSGSSWMHCWKAFFFSGVIWMWWIAMSSATSGAVRGAYRDKVSATNISRPGL